MPNRMPASRLSPVQRLIGLARSNGIDVRATLLRVVVDQFVADGRHTAAEVTRFGELVLNLIDKASEIDREIVATKLAVHPETPAAVARRLAADVGAVAAPVLRLSTALSDDDLVAAVRSGDAEKALAVAQREEIGLAPLAALEDWRHPAVRAALAQRVTPAVPARPAPGPQAAALPPLGEAFLKASTERREAMLAALALRPPMAPGAPPSDPDRRLELAALSRRPGALAEALGRLLDISPDHARRIADDPGGEPLLVIGRALDLGAAATQRILLFSHEAVGTSVGRLYGLTALYEALPRTAALALVRAWQGVAVRTGKHQPQLSPDGSDRVGARQAATVAPRTAGARERVAPQAGAKSTKGRP